ncbi:MAG: hypothetical protein J5934_08245 [Succinivibrio sp.]|nr:hypothetical protein [Succinivibrio sp.]
MLDTVPPAAAAAQSKDTAVSEVSPVNAKDSSQDSAQTSDVKELLNRKFDEVLQSAEKNSGNINTSVHDFDIMERSLEGISSFLNNSGHSNKIADKYQAELDKLLKTDDGADDRIASAPSVELSDSFKDTVMPEKLGDSIVEYLPEINAYIKRIRKRSHELNSSSSLINKVTPKMQMDATIALITGNTDKAKELLVNSKPAADENTAGNPPALTLSDIEKLNSALREDEKDNDPELVINGRTISITDVRNAKGKDASLETLSMLQAAAKASDEQIRKETEKRKAENISPLQSALMEANQQTRPDAQNLSDKNRFNLIVSDPFALDKERLSVCQLNFDEYKTLDETVKAAVLENKSPVVTAESESTGDYISPQLRAIMNSLEQGNATSASSTSESDSSVIQVDFAPEESNTEAAGAEVRESESGSDAHGSPDAKNIIPFPDWVPESPKVEVKGASAVFAENIENSMQTDADPDESDDSYVVEGEESSESDKDQFMDTLVNSSFMPASATQDPSASNPLTEADKQESLGSPKAPQRNDAAIERFIEEENRKLGRPLNDDDFYDKLVLTDAWYKDILTAGFTEGLIKSLLCHSERVIDPENNLKWKIIVSPIFSMVLGDAPMQNDIRTAFRKITSENLEIEFIQYVPKKGDKEFPVNSPKAHAIMAYLQEKIDTRARFSKDPGISELLRVFGQSADTVDFELYKQ